MPEHRRQGKPLNILINILFIKSIDAYHSFLQA